MIRTTADLRRFDPAQFGSYEELTVDWVDRRVEAIRIEAEGGNPALATLMQLELEECVLLGIACGCDGARAQQLAIAALRACDLTFVRPYAEVARLLSEPGAIGGDPMRMMWVDGLDGGISDTELRIELAGLLGWYKIEENSQGVLIGKLPGVRSIVPLMIPDWTTDPHQVQAVEGFLEKQGLRANYILNLLAICHVVETDEGSKLQVLAEASPRQRCEAVLTTLRGNADSP